jgi:hypothetical protein
VFPRGGRRRRSSLDGGGRVRWSKHAERASYIAVVVGAGAGAGAAVRRLRKAREFVAAQGNEPGTHER